MSGCVRFGLAAIAVSLACAPAMAASAENGKVAFIKNGCWQCHGFDGQGSVATSGGRVIANTKLPLEAFKAFVRNSSGEMPPFREQMLSDSDLADIYAYLESLPLPRPPSEIPLLKQQ
jgi:ubiquinol-cytochrome c reductase cytochrome c subunit